LVDGGWWYCCEIGVVGVVGGDGWQVGRVSMASPSPSPSSPL
jgi:hypothetical protein